MPNFSTRVVQRLPQGWQSKTAWITAGVATFWVSYLAGSYIAPFVALWWRVVDASTNVFINPPRLPLP